MCKAMTEEDIFNLRAKHDSQKLFLHLAKTYYMKSNSQNTKHTVVCKKIAAVYEKAHFWLFLVEIPLRFGKALNCR